MKKLSPVAIAEFLSRGIQTLLNHFEERVEPGTILTLEENKDGLTGTIEGGSPSAVRQEVDLVLARQFVSRWNNGEFSAAIFLGTAPNPAAFA